MRSTPFLRSGNTLGPLIWGLQLGVLCALLLLAVPARGEEPGGFLDRPWGTPWEEYAIRSLPGCAAQGEVITDVEGWIVRVAQPECVGYRFSDNLTVNLILLYPEIKWHRLQYARIVVHALASDGPLWGLKPETAVRLRGWSETLERLGQLRRVYDDDGPLFPDMADVFDLTDSARGLQGYQINFPIEDYAMMKSALIRQLGPPTSQTTEPDRRGGAGLTAPGEVLEWSGERTVAVMKEYGRVGTSGYFAIVTRGYRDLVTEHTRAAALYKSGVPRASVALRRNPSSYPWFLELIETFSWAGE